MRENGRGSQHHSVEINLSCSSSLVEANHPEIIIKIRWQREAQSPEDRGWVCLLWGREVRWINLLEQLLKARQKVDSENKPGETGLDKAFQVKSDLSARSDIRYDSKEFTGLQKKHKPNPRSPRQQGFFLLQANQICFSNQICSVICELIRSVSWIQTSPIYLMMQASWEMEVCYLEVSNSPVAR